MEEMFKDFPDIVNVSQLQEMLKIGRVLAYNLVKNRKIKSKKIGRDYKITKVEVVKYINGE